MSVRVAVLCAGIGACGVAAGAAGGIFAWSQLHPRELPKPDVWAGAPPEASAPSPTEDVSSLPGTRFSAPGTEFFGFAVGFSVEKPPAATGAEPASPAAPESRDKEAPAAGKDGLSRLKFMKDRCVAGFDGSSNLHDFSGWTRAVSGSIEFDRARIGQTARASVTVDARALKTGVAGRDRDMQNALESAKHPNFTFELASADIQGERMTMRGAMQIHGVKQDVEIPCTLKIRKDGYLYVKGELRTKMSKFGITPPVNAGILRVADDIRIWFEAWAEPAESGS